MHNETALTPIPDPARMERKLDIVFVHGLGDNDIDAWQAKRAPETFWPTWLADDFADLQVWMLRYAAAKFWFEPAAMALPDRATNVLDFLVDRGLGHRDLLFVTHSLGGLVVKQMLATSKMNADGRLGIIAAATRGVVYLATPHTGSNIATVVFRIGLAGQLVEGLRSDDPWLRWLKDWYRNNARGLGWKTRAFFETIPTGPSLVVGNSSADPNVEGTTAVGVDANHVNICKLSSRESQVYQSIVELIRECIREPRAGGSASSWKPAYFTVPPLPPNYVERGESLAALRQALVVDERRTGIAISALHGMGGIGKSVLAQALARDEIVQQAFPDGVIWMSVGKEPVNDLVTQLREIGKALNDELGGYDTKLGCIHRYRSLIRDKAVLIVLDDVWDPRDIAPFRADSPRSHLLFTARNETVASGTGARLIPTPFLDRQQSREVLARWSGRDSDNLPPEADAVARLCGGLPLALATIGAMLRGKQTTSWRNARVMLQAADLEKLKQKFPDYPYPDLLSALSVSINELDSKARERYQALAVLLEDMALHPRMQQALWSTDEFDAVETAEQYLGLALAQRAGVDGSIALHDLLLHWIRGQHPDPPVLRLIHDAIRLSSHVLSRDPAQFAPQLVGRLLPHAAKPGIAQFIESLASGAPRPWIRPRKPALQSPGTGLLFSLVGHTHWVTAVAIAPDGRRAVSASADKTLKVWDLETGRELHSLHGHTAGVTAVSITADGQRAVSGSNDGRLKVWNLDTGVEHQPSMKGHQRRVNAVTVTEDSKVAVSASDDKTIKLWDIESGREQRTLTGHVRAVTGVVLIPDSARALSASDDETLKLWDLASEGESEMSTIPVPAGSVRALAITTDGESALVAASHQQACVAELDLATGSQSWTLDAQSGSIRAIAVLPDGRRAVIGSDDGTLSVWDLDVRRVLRRLTGHADAIRAVALTRNGKRAISGSGDKTLKVWDIEADRTMRPVEGHEGKIGAVVFDRNGQRAVSGSADHLIKIWDVKSGREFRVLRGHQGAVRTVMFTRDDSWIVSASDDCTFKTWDAESGREIHTFAGHTGVVRSVAVTLDGRRAVSASDDQTLKMWDLESGCESLSLQGHMASVRSVVLTPDGRHAISGSVDKTLRVWDLEDGTEKFTLEGHTDVISALVLTPDGHQVISGSADHTLRVWDILSGRERYTLNGHTGDVRTLAVTPDGRRAVSGSNDHTLKTWDIRSGRGLRTLKGHADCINALSLTPDGRRAVSASADCTLRVWTLDEETPLATFYCDSSPRACRMSQDATIVAGDGAGRIYILTFETSISSYGEEYVLQHSDATVPK